MIAFTLSPSIRRYATLPLSLAAVLLVSGCNGDVRPRDNVDPVTSGQGNPPDINAPVNGGSDGSSVDNGQFRLELSATRFNITEGGETAGVTLNVVRQGGHSAPVTLELAGNSSADVKDINWVFSDATISGADTSSELRISASIGRAPIQRQTRQLTVSASDGSATPLEAVITLEITPTTGNMVGFSLPGARESDPGEPDAPNNRIFQLNVTGNDDTNHPNPAAFTNPNQIASADQRLVTALDPLHDGFDFSINSKESTRIGLGLSFAKAMLPSTTTNIVLVPAAWSDTGFCKTSTNIFPGVGWNATQPSDTTNFAGTLLHDRAIARLNLTLEASGGIFRGILWHQGEADSNDDVCAAAYGENLTNLVASIRTEARVDARGTQARGAAADVPFIAGTMSRGDEFADLWPAKEVVDGVHRNVGSLIPFAASVINDDLRPPNYPCGEGSCIHFGDDAYREIGDRYAERMRTVQGR